MTLLARRQRPRFYRSWSSSPCFRWCFWQRSIDSKNSKQTPLTLLTILPSNSALKFGSYFIRISKMYLWVRPVSSTIVSNNDEVHNSAILAMMWDLLKWVSLYIDVKDGFWSCISNFAYPFYWFFCAKVVFKSAFIFQPLSTVLLLQKKNKFYWFFCVGNISIFCTSTTSRME